MITISVPSGAKRQLSVSMKYCNKNRVVCQFISPQLQMVAHVAHSMRDQQDYAKEEERKERSRTILGKKKYLATGKQQSRTLTGLKKSTKMEKCMKKMLVEPIHTVTSGQCKTTTLSWVKRSNEVRVVTLLENQPADRLFTKQGWKFLGGTLAWTQRAGQYRPTLNTSHQRWRTQ